MSKSAIFHLLPDAPKPVAPYSHAVEAGGFVFVTGQLATDPDDDSPPVPGGHRGADAQGYGQSRARSRRAAGCVRQCRSCVRIFLTDFERDYAAMNAIYATLFRGRPPARRAPRSASRHLARGGIVEIDMIAKRD